ncbi:MAG TPA: BrnT family toxin [Candidatus Saccharimonadales bacterium]|nr:BrnT family toxin [Candidatus Saccharimonadales bacterium]
MRIIPEPLSFEWDKGNITKNLDKHNVTVHESEEVFSNEPFVIAEDVEHSTSKEQRFEALGKTRGNRKLFVSFTIRKNKVRVISIRDMSKKEVVTYASIEKNS